MIDLKERRKRLERALRYLSPTPTVVKMSDWTEAGENLVITAGTRLMKTDKRFTCLETFVDPREPRLHSFQYAVLAQGEEPIFRYECHPELTGQYVRVPHFHPTAVNLDVEMIDLHYPFTRATRETIAFALIQWLRVDFLNRFHHSQPQ